MSQNGRINFEGGTPFFLQDKIVKDSRTTYDNLKNSQQPTVVSTLFFSMKNVKILQNGIRAGVYKLSDEKYVIDNQSSDSLNVIMRAVYLQNSLNLPDNVTKQIEDLNRIVIQYCVPRIYSEVKGYIKYKEDASTLPVPMDKPMSVYVDKSVELKRFF
jgi:hypothetical protein